MGLYVKESGNKNAPILVFLHGGGVSGWMWEKQVQFLKEEYFVLIPDLPGHGNSGNEKFVSINKTAEDIINIIQERKNGQKVTIIGFSLGAQIALEILSVKEDIIDQAIIVSGLVRPLKYFQAILKPLIRISMPLTKSKSFAKLQAKVLYVGEEQFDLYFQDTIQMSVEDLLRVLEENMSYRIPDGFKRSKANILVLVGEKEKKTMGKSAVVITRSNRNCQGYMIPRVGHGISLANPDFFNKLVEAWMNEKELPKGMRSID
ncbi:alpha/beta hydrolase [Paenibacillus profundus]|uniref:Alpha/beta hydrolase n=1 Tax=Paenibacillus profundus TaxID=1173085 RepID=A0ABS8YQ22_9BACL|nr:alpha/beta hydrolase [Paenibacillus profundus]MCE5173382.1 alpha/beta hydrolase [Paenibacillus profundus]